jgi:hypothetical protein
MGLRTPWFHQTKVFSYGQHIIRFSYVLSWRIIILHAILSEVSRRCFRLLWHLLCNANTYSQWTPHISRDQHSSSHLLLFQPIWWLVQWLLYATVTANSVQQILYCFQTFGWRAYEYTAAFFFSVCRPQLEARFFLNEKWSMLTTMYIFLVHKHGSCHGMFRQM